MKFRILMILMVGFLLIPKLKASNLVDTLQERLATYNLEKPVINLYVHLDRNTYTPEDTLWFKAYVLTPILNEVLYVRITDRKKNKVLEKQFPMYDIRAHGDILIPDTLPEGTYYFYAYTDRMMSLNPSDVFVQPITVSNNILNRLEAEASVTNLKKVHRGDKVEILAKVKSGSSKSLKGKFSLWVGEQLLKKGSLATNSLGEAYVRFTYPKIDNSEMVRCEIRVNRDKEFAELILNLRHEGNSAKVNAYAEGGHFLDGVPNRAIFEILDDNKNPMEVPLDLLEDQKIIGRTKTNKHGLGNIRFTPRMNARYSLTVHENDTTTRLEFPGIIESEGYGLRIEKDKSHSTAVLTNRNQGDSALLVLRSMDRILWSQSLNIKNGDSIRIDLPLQDQPKAILNLAVFDSVSAPKAERYILSKSEDPYKVQFSTSKTIKKGRTSIKVNLSVTDSNNKPVATNLSVSVVEKNGLNKSTYRTILQSYYFKNMFGPSATVNNEYEPDFDDRLLTMNWGGKTWGPLLRFRPTGFIRLLENAGGITGYVTSKSKKPFKLERMMLESMTSGLINDLEPLSNMFQGGFLQNGQARRRNINYSIKDWSEPVPLNENGTFSISPKSLLVKPKEEKVLKPGPLFANEYDLKMNDYSLEMDEFVRLGESLNFPQQVNTFTKYKAPTLITLSKVILLKEVSVESRSGSYERDNNMGKKEDYICREYHVFNCKNHRTGGYKPEIGRIYSGGEGGKLFVYNGVGKPFSTPSIGAVAGSIDYLPIKNISKPSIFYNPEFSDSTFLKAETRTTVYWSPNLYADSTGRITFNCNTSDRTGDFTIIVQGVEVKTRKPIYGIYEFKL